MKPFFSNILQCNTLSDLPTWHRAYWHTIASPGVWCSLGRIIHFCQEPLVTASSQTSEYRNCTHPLFMFHYITLFLIFYLHHDRFVQRVIYSHYKLLFSLQSCTSWMHCHVRHSPQFHQTSSEKREQSSPQSLLPLKLFMMFLKSFCCLILKFLYQYLWLALS